MLLYLVHHAAAKTEEQDADRPLSERGTRDIRKVAAFLAKAGVVKVKAISHSGKTRALQTAAVLGEALRPLNGLKEVDGLSPLDSPEVWARRLEEAKEDTMLVGHLPHLSKLASLLLCGEEDGEVVAFQNGCMVCLEREEGSWSVRWLLTPELLAGEPDPAVLGRVDSSRFRRERLQPNPPKLPER